MCRALNSLAEERRKNQLLEHSSQVLEAKNHVLEARLEELHMQISEMDRRSMPPSRMSPATNANENAAEGSAVPQRGWWGSLWGAAPADATSPSPEKEDSTQHPGMNKEELQKELDEWNEVIAELSQTKLTLAEVQGKLAAALRESSRLRNVNDALNSHIEKLTEQGWTPYGSGIVDPP